MVTGNKLEKINKLLQKLYYNPATGFTSSARLFSQAQKTIKNITHEQVQDWLRKQDTATRFAGLKKKFPRAVTVSSRPNEIWVADLLDMASFRGSKSHRFCLLVQDMFSRKIRGLIVQKGRSSSETAKSFKKVFQKEAPHKIFIDNDTAFQGQCNALFRKFHVTPYKSKDPVVKVSIAERTIREIKKIIYRILYAKKSLKSWIDVLEIAGKKYNKSYNRTIRMMPDEASKRRNRSLVFYNTVIRRDRKKQRQFKFKVGQIVKLARYGDFQKSYTGNFSDFLYRIYLRKYMTGVPVYFIQELLTGEEVEGAVYGQELQAVDGLDPAEIPKIAKFHGIRIKDNNEQVLIRKRGKKDAWIDYASLIPYNSL